MNLDCCARIRAAGRVSCTAIVLLLTILQAARLPADDVEYRWGPPFVSDDGSTVIKFGVSEGMIGRFAPIGFFGPDGKQRAVVTRHGVWGDAVSEEDGYLAVWGYVTGKEGLYVTLYNPSGKPMWERGMQPDSPYAAAVAPKGRRTFVALRRDNSSDHWLVCLDKSGRTIRKLALTRHEMTPDSLQVVGGQVLMARINNDVRAYSADDMHELWRNHSAETIGVYGFAATPDMSHIAVLDGPEVKAGRDTQHQHPPRLRILDGRTGKLLKERSLGLSQADLDAYRPMRYSRERGLFAVKLKRGEKHFDANADPKDPDYRGEQKQ